MYPQLEINGALGWYNTIELGLAFVLYRNCIEIYTRI